MSKRKFDHERLGAIEYDDAEVITFPGLPGFPSARRFIVRAHSKGETLAWLISLDVPALAFAIASPFHFARDYAPRIPEEALDALRAETLDEIEIVAIAIASEAGLSLNLAAPILIDRARGRGLQWILEGDAHPLRRCVAPASPETAPARPSAQTESNPQT